MSAYYAVRVGREGPHVYQTWSDCEKNVGGVKGAVYKKFALAREAYEFAGVPRPLTHAENAERMAAYRRVVEEAGRADPHARAQLTAAFLDEEPRKRKAEEPPLPPPPKEARRGATPVVDVWTDGGCDNNGGRNAVGGIGVYWGPNHPRNVGEPLPGIEQTNNRAEISAVLRALDDTKHFRENGTELVIHTDSQFTIDVTGWVHRWKRNGWKTAKGGAVLNQDLIVRLDTALEGRRVTFKHVKGHGTNAGNIAADALATQGKLKALAQRR